MSTTIKNVAIAGASGSLGTPMVKALLDANFTVTALTRADSKSSFPTGVKVAAVDYDSKDSLQAALTGQDAVISALTMTATKPQIALFEAAAAAGVKRLIPGEFGSNTENARARALPVFKDKVEVEEVVERLAKESGGKITYTYVFNNAFLDWGITQNFLIDAKKKTYQLIDGGEGYFTTTPLAFVAKGTAAILQHPDETANRAVRLQGARLTQRQFLAIVQRVVGSEGWTVTEADSREMESKSYEVLKSDPSNIFGWLFPQLHVAIHAKEFGGDFGEEGERDNALLGLQTLSESEVEKVVRGVV